MLKVLVSDKRKHQWKQASRKRKENLQKLKLSTPKKYAKVRVGLNRSSRKLYARKANDGSDETKLARYHCALNKFEKHRNLIEYKLRTTRGRDLSLAMEKSRNNKDDLKALEALRDLVELQTQNDFV